MEVITFSNKEMKDHIHLLYHHFKQMMLDDETHGTRDVYSRFLNTMSLYAIREWFLGLEQSTNHYHLFNILLDDGVPVGVAQLSSDLKYKIGEISLSVLRSHRGGDHKTANMLADLILSSTLAVCCDDIVFVCGIGNMPCRALFNRIGGFSMKHSLQENVIIGKRIRERPADIKECENA